MSKEPKQTAPSGQQAPRRRGRPRKMETLAMSDSVLGADENHPEETQDIAAGSAFEEHERHAISQRAHEIWMEEGQPEGRDREHWIQAEMEIMNRRSRSAM